MSSTSEGREVPICIRHRKRSENITVFGGSEADNNEQDNKEIHVTTLLARNCKRINAHSTKQLKSTKSQQAQGNKKKVKKLTARLECLLQKDTLLRETASSSNLPEEPEEAQENEKNVKKLTARLERLFRRSAQLRKFSTFGFTSRWSKKQISANQQQASNITLNNADLQGLDLSPKVIDNSYYLALDCEMVGVGLRKLSALARCSITDYDGNIILDEYVKPKERITDYRTKYSGILPRHMHFAVPYHLIQERISTILQGKILVGHAVFNDLKVLNYTQPQNMTADTLQSKTLRTMAGYGPHSRVSLKKLSWALLGKKIQCRTHCSVEDARSTMSLFKLFQQTWEKQHGFINKADASDVVRNDSGYSSDDNSSFFSDEYWPEEMADI